MVKFQALLDRHQTNLNTQTSDKFTQILAHTIIMEISQRSKYSFDIQVGLNFEISKTTFRVFILQLKSKTDASK